MRKLVGVFYFMLAIGCIGAPAFAAETNATAKQPSEKQLAQRERMKDCNDKAGDIKGDERKKFMSSCLKSDHPSEKQIAQREKMTACKKEAGEKKLVGKARKEFMSSCLSS